MTETEPNHTQVQRAVLDVCREPHSGRELEKRLDYPTGVIQDAIRDLLYSGHLTSTPDWEFETANPKFTETNNP